MSIPHFPEHKITISINGVRFPSKIDEQLRFHINGSYLKQHLQRRYGWNEKLWYLIDFETFGRHFTTLPVHKQVQHMKFVHDIQPIGSHYAKFASSTTDHMSVHDSTYCPCCRTEVETQTHMLHCSANPRRRQTLIDFTKKCKRRDANWFLPIFADLIGQWMADSTKTPTFDKCRDTFLRHDIIPIAYSSLVQQAIIDQTMIGWIHAVRGFLSKSWLQLASSSFRTNSDHVSHQHDGLNRLQQVLKALHFLSTEIWAGRNDILHGHKQNDVMMKQTLVDAAITRYHSEPELLLHDDSHYCAQSLARLLRSSSSNKRRWLHRVKASRLKKATILHRQPRITTHFKSTTTSPGPDDNYRPPNISRAPVSENPSHHRTVTVQRLMTFFFRKRAPNPQTHGIPHKSPATRP